MLTPCAYGLAVTRADFASFQLPGKVLGYATSQRHVPLFQWMSSPWVIPEELWKVVPETFRRRPGKLSTVESFFTRTMLLHTSLWLQWLLCGLWLWTGWPLSTFFWFGTVWLFSVPQHIQKNTWLGSIIGPMMWSYLQLRTFSRIRMRASMTTRIQALQHRLKRTCVAGGLPQISHTHTQLMLNNKPHIWSNSTIAS